MSPSESPRTTWTAGLPEVYPELAPAAPSATWLSAAWRTGRAAALTGSRPGGILSTMSSTNAGAAEAAWGALPVGREALLDAARSAYARAYSPYSRVKVGAALVDREGRVFVGCNVENASHGLTVCAERNAIGRAVVEGAAELLAVAIASDRGDPLMPCGACRQVLTEFSPEMLVATVGVDGSVVLSRLDELLPLAFTPRDLER